MAVPHSGTVSLMLFLRKVLQDLEGWCGTSTVRDLKTITERVEHEGLSFLAITLPNFGKEFEKALDQGFVAPNQFLSFSRSGCLPRFLAGFTEFVFDRSTGRLLDAPSVPHIRAVRQITLMFGKINLPCSNARTDAAIRNYVECERVLKDDDRRDRSCLQEALSRMSHLLWSDTLHVLNRRISDGDIVPLHGSGATANRLTGNGKWRCTTWTRRLDAVFPIVDYLLPNASYYQELDHFTILEPGSEIPVWVVTVPKTPKAPRIIAEEPSYVMYAQKGLLSLFVEAVEADDLASKLIGWNSQEPNQRLAAIGSRNGSLATLDLSDASDRVSVWHVEALLGRDSDVYEAVMASRSTKAKVPGHGIIPLAKFASMGSALTFPLESMVFATVVFLGIEKALNRQLTYRDITRLVGRVRVYGDDIIVPTDCAEAVQQTLELFGFKVNADKSFWTGRFRESCGKEYYAGSDVSIVRVRSLFPAHRNAVRELERTVALRNHLYFDGMWNAAAFLDSVLGRLIPFPRVAETAHVLGRHSFLGYETQRMHADLHHPLVKGVVVVPHIPADVLDGVPALLKVLTTHSELPNPDVTHLERAGRPSSSHMKTGWYRPF